MVGKKRKRRTYLPEDKVAYLRRHLLQKVPFSDICEELGIHGYHIDLEGVRRHDVEYLLEMVLCLESHQWSITRWRKYERYVALTHREALRVSKALGGTHRKGSGRMARQEYLLEGLTIPVTVRTRARLPVEVVIYRTKPYRGATCSWKMEARIKGRTSNRGNFEEEEPLRELDKILLKLSWIFGRRCTVDSLLWLPSSSPLIDCLATLPPFFFQPQARFFGGD
jgi:hypothetical protein